MGAEKVDYIESLFVAHHSNSSKFEKEVSCGTEGLAV